MKHHPSCVYARGGRVWKTTRCNSPAANGGLYIEEFICSITKLCVVQFTHDRLASLAEHVVVLRLTQHVHQCSNHIATTVNHHNKFELFNCFSLVVGRLEGFSWLQI